MHVVKGRTVEEQITSIDLILVEHKRLIESALAVRKQEQIVRHGDDRFKALADKIDILAQHLNVEIKQLELPFAVTPKDRDKDK